MAVAAQGTALPTRAQPYKAGPQLVEGYAEVAGDLSGGLASIDVFLEANDQTLYMLESLYMEGAGGTLGTMVLSSQFVRTPTSSFVSKAFQINLSAAGQAPPSTQHEMREMWGVIKSHPGVPSLSFQWFMSNVDGALYRLGVTAWRYDLTAMAGPLQLVMPRLMNT